ncbi:hypothetical protein B0H15DRAFT_954419 [Mycena belliarum]|uniref:Uncharacterized protein n=1 Tax=Mycena belliarum TaxID=1033014 RepID=A0AAD6TT40_9AGAR|nr:hypothetical protein B0H15DRAFT_954419 [Mycena belliae]
MHRALESPEILRAIFAVAEGDLMPLLECLVPRVWGTDMQARHRVLRSRLMLSEPRSRPTDPSLALSASLSRATITLLSSAFHSPTSLQCITLPTLHASSLPAFAALPHLASLALPSYCAPLSPARLAALFPPSSRAFPALRILSLAADTLTSAFALIVHVASPTLRALRVEVREEARAEAWEAALRVLAYLPCRHSLTELELGRPGPHSANQPTQLRPKMRLPSLTHVRVHPPLVLVLARGEAGSQTLARPSPRLGTLFANPSTNRGKEGSCAHSLRRRRRPNRVRVQFRSTRAVFPRTP